MAFAVFHDFPGMENGPPKFHDFLGPVGTEHPDKFRCLSHGHDTKQGSRQWQTLPEVCNSAAPPGESW